MLRLCVYRCLGSLEKNYQRTIQETNNKKNESNMEISVDLNLRQTCESQVQRASNSLNQVITIKQLINYM